MKDKIVSKDNKKFKLLKKLLLPKGRKEESLFIAEGKKFLDYSPLQVFVNENVEDVSSCTVLSNELFKEISSQENSQGIISLFEIPKIKYVKSQFILVLDKIRDPGNLGTIIRTAEFFGIKDILLIDSVDTYNPKVVRATMGAILNINFINYKKEEDIINFLNNNDYAIISSSLYNYTHLINEIEVKEKIALVLGNESRGVSKIFLDNSKIITYIPSFGSVESLNVSAAASILIYLISNKLNT